MTDINKELRTILKNASELGDGFSFKDEDEAIAKIKALVVESLPKEHECTKECNINSNEWRRGHLAYKDGLKAGLREIRSIFE